MNNVGIEKENPQIHKIHSSSCLHKRIEKQNKSCTKFFAHPHKSFYIHLDKSQSKIFQKIYSVKIKYTRYMKLS